MRTQSQLSADSESTSLEHERRLVRRLLAGEKDAFEAFFSSAFPALFRFAEARLRDADGAEDVAQQTLCQAVNRLTTWRGEASLQTWLFTIARHELSAWAHKNRRPVVALNEDQPEIRAALEPLATAGEGPEAATQRRELAYRIRSTLDLLPGRYGAVLSWKYLDDCSVREIAERLGVSLKAAESTLTRARTAFRDGFSATAQELGT